LKFYNCNVLCLIVPVCPPLTAPDNGKIDCSLKGDGDANPGDTCTFSCDGGYELQGSSVRTCRNSGVWSGTSAVCEKGMIGYVRCHNSIHYNLAIVAARCNVFHKITVREVELHYN